jgi:hypothetical protein
MKITEEIIVALKNNKVAYGLMDEDLRKAVQELSNYLITYQDGTWMPLVTFLEHPDAIYRLREDYKLEPESEIVECEIKPQGDHLFYFSSAADYSALHAAIDRKDFIGFRFIEDEADIVCGCPVMYEVVGQTNRGYYTPYSYLEVAQNQAIMARVIRAKSVLFRRSK